jgi:endonuclease/exonuclease/phosphatase family metal-dependent hydrolase
MTKRVRIATQNVWRRHGDWAARRPVLRAGFAELDADVVGFQEAIVTDEYDQARDLLGDGYHFAYQQSREDDGGCVTIASRWPIAETHELDGRTVGRAGEEPFNAGTLTAVIEAPPPLGTFLFVNHIPSWQLHFELERERQTVAAARQVEELLAERQLRHAVLAGDLDATPEAGSIRFLRGQQSLDGTSVVYIDAWQTKHPGEAGHTFTPENPLCPTGEGGYWILEQGRRIDYVFVRGGEHGTTLRVVSCERLFDQPVDGVYASDHFGVTVDLSPELPDGRPVP